MLNLERTLTKYYKLVLVIIFFIALILRWVYLPYGAVSFAYDQARDAFIVQDILKGDIKILGPSVSGVPGLYHGVLYYYVIALAYHAGAGNPIIVAYFLSFISSLVIFAVFYLTYLLTNKYTPSIFSALIIAFSYEATQYSNLLTNASMGTWFVPLIYIAIIKVSPALLGVSFGLAVQSEVALLYHLIPIIIFCVKRFSSKQLITSFAFFILSTITMIFSEFKFGFTGVKGLIYIVTGQDSIGRSKTLFDYLETIINQSGLTFAYTIMPLNLILGGLAGFLVVIVSLMSRTYWSRILGAYIFSFVLALPFGGWNMKHILVGVAPAVAVIVSIFLWNFVKKSKVALYTLLTLILLSNLFAILKNNINGQTIFPLQGDLVLANELKVIDYTYNASERNNFSISTLTSPLYINTLWSYLYNWYGFKTYGYIPTYLGQDQVGNLGNNLSKAQKDEFRHYYIEEPTYGIPQIYVQYARGDQNSVSELIESKYFGELRVEQREFLKYK